MRRLLRHALAALTLLAPTPALAVDTSYYTWGGFSETVDAFRLVALIFGDPRYEALVVIIGVVGIGFGAVLASVRGSGIGLVAFGFQMLVGIGLFAGMIATTGTVNVYDRVKNGYMAVGGVPNLIVVVAGVTNLMERSLVETIDDNTTDPNAKMAFGAGGHAFDLFLNAVSPRSPMVDSFLDATVRDYVRQCYPVARVSPAYGVDDDKLFRTSTDLPTAFAAMAGPATFSTVYTQTDKAGTTQSCDAAWGYISDRLNDPAVFDAYSDQVCARTGYDPTDTSQRTKCRQQIDALGGMMLGQPMSRQKFLTNAFLGDTVGDVLFEDSPAAAARVMANRAVVSNGLSTLSTANEWMPTIRAAVFAIMLMMMPIALLFILTPINLRVASFALGLFVFVALWGVIDAGIYQLTLGRAMGVLAELRATNAAANTWILAPSAAMKALAIFGSFRTAAAGLAGAFVFTVFRFSGNVFSAVTGESMALSGQGATAATGTLTSEGYASALESQASAMGTMGRRSASSGFGDFGARSSFGVDRAFGAAGSITGQYGGGAAGTAAFSLGRTDAARELGGLAPALTGRDLSDPATASAVRANATTSAIHNFAQGDALRSLGTTYFGSGQAGERAFASFAQNMVQWKAFGDQRAYDMMRTGAERHFERNGYSPKDAALKASTVIGEAASDPLFAKLSANAFDQETLLRNDLTAAQVQVGAMEGRRDYAGDDVAANERANVATEQAHRTGTNRGQRDAAEMLGLPVDEASRRIGFINTLTGEARSSAISRLAHSTGRNEAQVVRAMETYGASVQLGTADGATSEAAREGTSVYGRTAETSGYDFAERAGKLDAQREVGRDGTRSAARVGEQRRQADNAGFAEGAAAAGVSVREAARLDAFIRSAAGTAGNQVDMAEGGAAGVMDRSRNERLTKVVDNERLTRFQSLLRAHGIDMSKRQIAMDANGDFGMNLSPALAAAMWRGGLINESQLGAIANGGHARLSFNDNDMLVSSSTNFSKSGRSDSSTKFEAGKQAGPDTIESFMGGGAEGQAAMQNWLRGGFEMDRKGNWRLKPQVADTLERDVSAIIVQTGWSRSLHRSASHQISNGSDVGGQIGAGVSRGGGSGKGAGASGSVGVQLGYSSRDIGTGTTEASASMDIVNYDVRNALAGAEKAASRSADPAAAFSSALSREILGSSGLRNRYLEQSDSGRGVRDLLAPITTGEQRTILDTGRFSGDLDRGPLDGDPEFKKR